MPQNMGSVDRWLRIIVGLGIVSLAYWGPQSPWAWLGLILVLTGLIGYCPCYTFCGVSTKKCCAPHGATPDDAEKEAKEGTKKAA